MSDSHQPEAKFSCLEQLIASQRECGESTADLERIRDEELHEDAVADGIAGAHLALFACLLRKSDEGERKMEECLTVVDTLKEVRRQYGWLLRPMAKQCRALEDRWTSRVQASMAEVGMEEDPWFVTKVWMASERMVNDSQ